MRGCHVIHVTRSFGAGGPAGRRAGGPAGGGAGRRDLADAAACSERLTGWATVAATVNPRQRGEPWRWKVKKLLVLVITGLAVTAPSASGAANSQQAPCIALFTSNQAAGEVGVAASSNAREARPFGFNVISGSAQLREPCGE